MATDLITKLEEASIKALSEVADQSMQVGELWGGARTRSVARLSL